MNIKRLQNESLEEYRDRLFAYKEDNYKSITWDDVADLMNFELEANFTADKYKKEYYRLRKQNKLQFSNPKKFEETKDAVSLSLSLQDQLAELRKERTIISDIRTDARASLRRIDREEHIIEIAKEFAEVMSSKEQQYKFFPIKIYEEHKAGLLLLSDWHYGLEIDDYFNKYDISICKERLNSILHQTIKIAKDNGLSTIYIYNLSDLISGRIHAQLRMQSRVDAVTQTMEVSELLYNFIVELSKHFFIEYYDCRDNHSRVEPNKKESLHLESFARIIHWYLASRFENNKRVSVHDNLSDDIIVTDILGHMVVGVHGDNDKPTTAVNKLSSFLGERPDLIVMGHKHHFSADEKNECMLIMNPSLMGADRFALDLRETSKPAQTLIIMTNDNPTYAVYRLVVDNM